ncbi:MAG: DNA-3-methyladenine glycosylase [Gemmobacter sp.]|nr:DNA-3-methyladenine glycosylase [Gemmobacter sp.]
MIGKIAGRGDHGNQNGKRTTSQRLVDLAVHFAWHRRLGLDRGGADLIPLPDLFFARDVVQVARDLVGAWLQLGACGGWITETEAYAADDPASHSFRGQTPRNAAMFGPPGTAYVYRSYGLHWCLNVTCLPGSAVLFRSMEPVAGLDLMVSRRQGARPLAAGPGRLGQALGVSAALNGQRYATQELLLAPGPVHEIVCGPRIGIRQAADRPWRFGQAKSPYLSRPFPAA